MNQPFTAILLLIILATFPLEYSTGKRVKPIELFNPILRTIKSNFGRLFEKTEKSIIHRKLLKGKSKAVEPIPESVPFPCNLNGIIRSKSVPRSAHELRPGDIDVVGALGDSLSAGTGISASTLIQELFLDQRGRSFSIGGESTWRTYLTLPNILKNFNPKLIGYGLKAAQSFEWESQFNVAENGAISSDLPYMATELVKRIKNDPRVDFENDWKMITIMIGANDFCSQACYCSDYYDTLTEHQQDLITTLRYLKENLPRTIVNVIPPPHVTVLTKLSNLPLECYLIHTIACPCITGLAFKGIQGIMVDIINKWQQIDIEVSNMDEFDTEDFTVIPHLYTTNYSFPTTLDGKLDYAYLAPDCFHFSEKAQARFANDLWNSILEPVGNKSNDGNDTFSKFLCPTEENPYIFTRRNSR